MNKLPEKWEMMVLALLTIAVLGIALLQRPASQSSPMRPASAGNLSPFAGVPGH